VGESSSVESGRDPRSGPVAEPAGARSAGAASRFERQGGRVGAAICEGVERPPAGQQARGILFHQGNTTG